MSRNSYHSELKCLARENLLSPEIAILIPRSNLWRWKREFVEKYKTFDLNLKGTQDYELIRSFSQNKKAKRVFSAYVRLSKFFLSLSSSVPNFKKQVREMKAQVVEVIGRVKDSIGLTKVLRAFNISVQTFRNWSAQSMTQCFESLTGSCNRVFHNQLSRSEVLKLKEMVTDDQFRYWPVSSIALHALRNNILPLSINTWYKYINKLGLALPRSASRRKKNSVSVRAERPHQIWHADITVFVTTDQVKHYIYAVVDNFSRKILSWLIADSVKVEYRRATIEDALKNINETHSGITLITDGGPENRLQTFLDSLCHPVEHKIALVDVHYSNSLIEASFKTAKYNYLYRMDIHDRNDLQKSFAFTVQDFNERPHISLNGLSPNEAAKNIHLNKEQLRSYLNAATAERKNYNRSHRCGQCKS